MSKKIVIKRKNLTVYRDRRYVQSNKGESDMSFFFFNSVQSLSYVLQLKTQWRNIFNERKKLVCLDLYVLLKYISRKVVK